jgi:hypothetical protein
VAELEQGDRLGQLCGGGDALSIAVSAAVKPMIKNRLTYCSPTFDRC